jgi:hypothetical protein
MKRDLGAKESNTPEEHGLGKAEKECQVLEPVDIVPAFVRYVVLWRK